MNVLLCYCKCIKVVFYVLFFQTHGTFKSLSCPFPCHKTCGKYFGGYVQLYMHALKKCQQEDARKTIVVCNIKRLLLFVVLLKCCCTVSFMNKYFTGK